MATTPDSMKGMVAIGSAKDKTGVLGYLTWFSIPDESVGLRRLKATLAGCGLSPKLAPSDQKAINTFKRAMREQETRVKNGAITETTVAQVGETPEDCVYQISRMVRDLDERVIEYPKVARVIFNKQTEEISFNNIGKIPQTEMFALRESINEFMDKNGTKITGARVRTVVRRYLRDDDDEQRGVEGLSGENLRGKAGGIYFIPVKFAAEVEALSDMLAELYHGKAYLHAIPMADSKSEREIIRKHHIANTHQEMKEEMVQVRALLNTSRERAPRSDVVAHHWSKFRALQRRAGTYNEILENEQEEVKDMGAALEAQLSKLL